MSQIRDFLMEMFDLNRQANTKMVSNISKLSAPEESIRLLSHLVNCQYKWLDRIRQFPEDSNLDWWDPLYSLEELPEQFEKSSLLWIDYLSDKSDDEIETSMKYVGYDGSTWEARLKDIALQLIFHSFHHRAQMQMMVRSQGQKPAFIDYIGYKAKKTGTT